MELFSYFLCAFGGIGLIYANVFADIHRDTALWMSCVSAVLFVVGGFAFAQDLLWKRDLRENSDGDQTLRVEKISNRAYLGAREPELKEFTVGKKIDWSITFVNSGNSPADVVEKSIGIVVFSSDTEFHGVNNSDVQRIESLPVFYTIHPDGGITITDEGTTVLTQEQLESINNQTHRMYFTAAVFYRDVIDNELRTTRACFYWNPEKSKFYSHDEGNYSD